MLDVLLSFRTNVRNLITGYSSARARSLRPGAVRDDKVKIAARASCKIVRNQVSERSETPGISYSQSYITINRGSFYESPT